MAVYVFANIKPSTGMPIMVYTPKITAAISNESGVRLSNNSTAIEAEFIVLNEDEIELTEIG